MCLRHTAGECDGASVAPTSVHATVSHRCRWWNVSIHTEKTPYRHAQDAIPHLMQWIVPLWEDAAASMGLPRDLDGVMRLHRAACYSVRRPVAVAVWVGVGVYMCVLLQRHWVVPSLTATLCLQDDPLVMELTWAGMATMTDAQRLILDQQALLDL